MNLVTQRNSGSVTLGLFLLYATLPFLAFAQPFTFYFQRSDLEDVQFGDALWGDYDNDGDFDVLLTGASRSGSMAKLYRYDGVEQRRVFLETLEYASYEVEQTFDVGGWYGSGAWGDYDNDGDLDVVLLGAQNREAPHNPSTKIFKNEDGQFIEQDFSLPGLFSGSASWGDYDNDGDLDLLLTGAIDFSISNYLSEIYRNDGDRFVAVGSGLPGLFSGSGSWGDYDRDGDLDILLTGASKERFLSSIYRNDDLSFQDSGAGLTGLMFSTGSWGDYNNDGDLDVLLTGAQLGPTVMNGYTRVYSNHEGSFSERDLDLRGVFYGSGAWCDYNNDGTPDMVLMGNDQPLGQRVGRIYMSENNEFTHVSNLPGTFLGSLAQGDHDGDGDVDLLTIGTDQEFNPRTALYNNEQRTVNERPSPPSSLQTSALTGGVNLSWNSAVDAETVVSGLSYNLRVGTTPGGSEIMSPMADPVSGRRRIGALGNVGQNTQWMLQNLAVGTYYWSVQALDQSYVASPFAEEGTFDVTSTGNIATSTSNGSDLVDQISLSQNYPNPFARTTTITYVLPQTSNVTLSVFNVLGERVKVLVQHTQTAGVKSVSWDGADGAGRRVSPGVYFYRLNIGKRILSKKLIMVN